MQSAWGDSTLGLYALPAAPAAAPQHGPMPYYPISRLPRQLRRLRVPLFDRRRGRRSGHLAPALLKGLPPPTAFDRLRRRTCSTRSSAALGNLYTTRVAEDREDVFPHVPFPANQQVSSRRPASGARFGQSRPAPARRVPPFAPTNSRALRPRPARGRSDERNCRMAKSAFARTAAAGSPGFPASIWAFEVSGIDAAALDCRA
jgi:hypothetical protein